MVMDGVEVITSVERRRRWSATEKARLVAAMNEPGAMVSEIARREGVDASLLYRWRRQFAAEREAPRTSAAIGGEIAEGRAAESRTRQVIKSRNVNANQPALRL